MRRPDPSVLIDTLSDDDRRAIHVVVTAENVAATRSTLLHIFRRTGPVSRDWPMLVDARAVDAGDPAAVRAVARLVAQAAGGVFVKRALVGSRALVAAVSRLGPARFGQVRGFPDVESAVPWVLDQVPSFAGMLAPPARRGAAGGAGATPTPSPAQANRTEAPQDPTVRGSDRPPGSPS